MAGRIRAGTFAVLVAAALTAAAPAGAASAATAPGHYDHLFVIVEENHGFADVIGNPAAPNLNALAARYGTATDYFGVAHPSEPNYVGLLGGDTFGVADDNPYYVNRAQAPSLISQLDQAGLPWKAYLQGLPHPGYQGICYPANCNGAPDKDPLYVSKHNAIGNFTTSLNPADWARQVSIAQLATDLRRDTVPAFGYVIPDECHDQHGDPPYCIDSGNPGDSQDQRLVAVGDRYLGQLVATITGAPFWGKSNNAIAITYDEGDDDAGCCGTTPGGGRVATVVVTSHGPRGLKDPTPYNHYSLLKTIQQNFGLGCLAHSCDAAVTPISPLLAVTGAPATPVKAVPVPDLPTPPPTLSEPVGTTTDTTSSGGWTLTPTVKLGTNDNTFGAVAAVSGSDVWTVGDYLPDTPGSNQDATLTLAAHYDGTRWTSTPTPNPGPNFSTLFGIAAVPGRAWAVGVRLDAGYHARSLIEAWNGTAWRVVDTPRLNTRRDMLFSAAATGPADVWAVGQRQSGDGTFATLAEHWDGRMWTVVPTPDPGDSGNQLTGVAANGPDDVWAVGQRNDREGDRPLAEHWDGYRWSVATVPGAGLLDGVAVHGGQVWAVGQTDDAVHQGRPLVAHLHDGRWDSEVLGTLGAPFSNLTGIAVAGDGTPWAVGTYFDAASGNQHTLVARHDGTGWHAVPAPSPGTGDAVLGGLAAHGTALWAVGFAKTDGRDPIVLVHQG
jgi:Phosphoesterase family